MECLFEGLGEKGAVTGELLSAAPGAHNTFDAPEAVTPKAMTGIQFEKGRFSAVLPPCSVAAFRIVP